MSEHCDNSQSSQHAFSSSLFSLSEDQDHSWPSFSPAPLGQDCLPYLMIHDQLRRRPLTLLVQRTVLQHGMHVLPVEHVVHVSPPLLVVVEIVHAHGLAGLPVAVDQLLEHNGVPLRDVDIPFVQPPRAVRRARDRCADLAREIVSLVDGDQVAGAAEGDGHGHAAYPAAHDTDIELSPLGGQWVPHVGIVSVFVRYRSEGNCEWARFLRVVSLPETTIRCSSQLQQEAVERKIDYLWPSRSGES